LIGDLYVAFTSDSAFSGIYLLLLSTATKVTKNAAAAEKMLKIN
jgi:hypothetical protein